MPSIQVGLSDGHVILHITGHDGETCKVILGTKQSASFRSQLQAVEALIALERVNSRHRDAHTVLR